MVVKKCAPHLRGRFRGPDHVLANARFPDLDAELEQFARYLRRAFDDDQRTSPIGPNFTNPNPEESIGGYQFRPFDRTLQNTELVAQGQNLELESRSTLKRAEDGTKERR